MKIKNIGKEKCSLDSLLMAISEEYQNSKDHESRLKIIENFKEDFKNAFKRSLSGRF